MECITTCHSSCESKDHLSSCGLWLVHNLSPLPPREADTITDSEVQTPCLQSTRCAVPGEPLPRTQHVNTATNHRKQDTAITVGLLSGANVKPFSTRGQSSDEKFGGMNLHNITCVCILSKTCAWLIDKKLSATIWIKNRKLWSDEGLLMEVWCASVF